ncbi:MAG: DUF6802 family protein [Pseudonocardia sp.]
MPERDPAMVPDEHGGLDVRAGLDSDGDGRPDTVLTWGDGSLLLHTDLDGDGFADQVLGIGPDGAVRAGAAPAVPEPDADADADPMIVVWEP